MKNYSIKINGYSIPSISIASEIIGLKQPTLYKRLIRNGGFLNGIINGYQVVIKELNIDEVIESKFKNN